MANPEEHLKMSEKYYKRAKSDFKKAETLEELEDKVCYFASSAEFLLASLDHLLGWFTRSDEFTGRIGRKNAFMCHKNIRKLGKDKKTRFLQFFSEVEETRNKIFYLHSTNLNDVKFISNTDLKLLLRRYKNVCQEIRRIR